MAVALAEEGGIGVIDRGFRAGDIAPQAGEVVAVKRTQHGIITDPHTIDGSQSVGDALRLSNEPSPREGPDEPPTGRNLVAKTGTAQ